MSDSRHDGGQEDRCDEHEQFMKIDAAFRAGDLEALRAAVDDPGHIPNGLMPRTIGSCLEYAIYHSPLSFIRELLAIGADPNPPPEDHAGFPPLIAALTKTRTVPGSTRRDDVPELLALLLAAGADPNQRGINDYTPLHMAVSLNDKVAATLLLAHGADRTLRTRIDECETPSEMAAAAGLADLATLLSP